MAIIHILDSITLPGSPDKANEDQFGRSADSIFVIDGATGLGDDFVVCPPDSDAAWLATFAKTHFEEMLKPGISVKKTVRKTNELARRIISFAAEEQKIPDWNLPIAGFQMVRLEDNKLMTYGLGDCTLYWPSTDGIISIYTAMPGGKEHEFKLAKKAQKRSEGFDKDHSLLADEKLLKKERKQRASFNQKGSPIWTLGAAPKAADHLYSAKLDIEKSVVGLLATDGFTAIVENYGLWDPEELLEVAKDQGLAHIGEKLRHIETKIDPDGNTYPRLKQSDDATAILFEVVV